MAGNDPGLRINQDRICESEFGYARGDLRHLCIGVRPRISGIRNQPINWPDLDPPCHRAGDWSGRAGIVVEFGW